SNLVDWSPDWLDIDVTFGVQEMSLGQINHGWRLQAISGNRNTKRFYSKEAITDIGLRPKLVIKYH
ncbi:MAG: hypothetical protein QNK36_05550, partial [Colwellia sp.]|nr:hypothetical protein [Colwellia sp.]